MSKRNKKKKRQVMPIRIHTSWDVGWLRRLSQELACLAERIQYPLHEEGSRPFLWAIEYTTDKDSVERLFARVDLVESNEGELNCPREIVGISIKECNGNGAVSEKEKIFPVASQHGLVDLAGINRYMQELISKAPVKKEGGAA